MVTNLSLFLIFITATAVTAQTFQYSRGWTNGKRGVKRTEDVKEFNNNLEKILSPCRMNKLKYLLEGKPLNEGFLIPCEYVDEDEGQQKRYKNERDTELFNNFQ